MTDCTFCKIINKEFYSHKIYENSNIYAFLDISQCTLGHTLVIPKKHVKDLFDYTEEMAMNTFSCIPKIIHSLKLSFPNIKGLNLISNNKKLAYQNVFHSHIHLIPRYSTNDSFNIYFGDHTKKYNKHQLKKITKIIKKNLK